MTLARVGEIEIDYERAGSGPPLLMIMGRSGTYSHWGEPFLEELRRDFETIVYDHRGVGRSSRLEGPLTIAEMARDAAGLLDALGVETAHVLGISMGGMVAQELVLAEPERSLTLTLGCTSCGGAEAVWPSEEVQRRFAEALDGRDPERAIRVSWETNVSPGFAADERAWERFRELTLRRRVAIPVIVEQTRAILAHDTSGRLPEIELPTLVVHGSADEILPLPNGRRIAGLIEGSRLEVLDGVGHLFFWERPERAAELLRAHAATHA
jgi:pimeloyl-ACP methyl ester carboxylesterase